YPRGIRVRQLPQGLSGEAQLPFVLALVPLLHTAPPGFDQRPSEIRMGVLSPDWKGLKVIYVSISHLLAGVLGWLRLARGGGPSEADPLHLITFAAVCRVQVATTHRRVAEWRM